MAPVIDAQKLFKRYPGFAPVLRGANLQVEPGEMVAVMGPSGCGKSTMLHILGLLHAPDSGSLEILGTDVLSLSREQTSAFRRANLGFVMQASNLFEHSTVFENVEFPLIYDNVPPQERWARVIRALELVRLSARVHYPGNRLSGGEQQRVAIARAMVNNPRILLADEPTGALDARTSRLIMENFRNLCHTGGVSMVMVTHDPAMADFCDTIYALEDGGLVCKKHGSPPYTTKDAGKTYLQVPEPLVSGALVSGFFPKPSKPDLSELARFLYNSSLLARIYALFSRLFRDNGAGYALPLPVRRINFFTRLFGVRLFWNRARSSTSMWNLWRSLPAGSSEGIGLRKRLLAFLSGAILARWGIQDNIRFFFAANAGFQATAVWVAAALLRVPFAFFVMPDDLKSVSPNWNIKAQAATCVICPSRIILEKAREAMPLAPAEKFMLAYPPPVVQPTEEEMGNSQLREASTHTEILAAGKNVSRDGFATLVKACGILKKSGASFRISILAKSDRATKRKMEKENLSLEMVFLGEPRDDAIAESFKTADIFVNFIPDNNAEKLIIPVYLREALAFGVAIAADGASAGASEILLSGQNCLVSQPGDTQELAKNLQILCDKPELRKSLANAGKNDLANLVNLPEITRKLSDLTIMAAARN